MFISAKALQSGFFSLVGLVPVGLGSVDEVKVARGSIAVVLDETRQI